MSIFMHLDTPRLIHVPIYFALVCFNVPECHHSMQIISSHILHLNTPIHKCACLYLALGLFGIFPLASSRPNGLVIMLPFVFTLPTSDSHSPDDFIALLDVRYYVQLPAAVPMAVLSGYWIPYCKFYRIRSNMLWPF